MSNRNEPVHERTLRRGDKQHSELQNIRQFSHASLQADHFGWMERRSRSPDQSQELQVPISLI